MTYLKTSAVFLAGLGLGLSYSWLRPQKLRTVPIEIAPTYAVEIPVQVAPEPETPQAPAAQAKAQYSQAFRRRGRNRKGLTTQQAILKELSQSSPLTARDLSYRTARPKDQVQSQLSVLKRDGKVAVVGKVRSKGMNRDVNLWHIKKG